MQSALAMALKSPMETKNDSWLAGEYKGAPTSSAGNGLIGATIHTEYGVSGKKDPCSNVIPAGANLREIMKSCYDISQEESLLQSMGRKMGININQLPKWLVSEVIKYSWCCQRQWS